MEGGRESVAGMVEDLARLACVCARPPARQWELMQKLKALCV